MNSSDYQFSARTHRMKASIIREILKISARKGMTSFAGGLPAPETFPIKQFGIALHDALTKDGTRALQYTVTEGHQGLKQYLCDWLKKQDMSVRPEQMILTHGSQQALDFLGKIFIDPNSTVLLEDPSYLGAIQSFNQYQPRYVTVPMDDQGIDLDLLKKQLKRHPHIRFIYTVPTFQNPSGITMSLERRLGLIKLAREHKIPIIEDDPYSRLRFRNRHVPSLYALAKGKGVIFLSTFSKLLSPGIRLGLLIADDAVLRQIVFAKQASDLQNNTLIQYAGYHYFRRGFFEKHIPFIIDDYARRAKAMSEAIKTSFPSNIKVFEPDGGMFFWCELPQKLKSSLVFKKAIQKNVAFVDGSVFYANGGGENTMRLNFTNSTEQTIQSGIKTLGQVISDLS